MSITIRQLQQFVAVAESGSFRAAANVLYTAQPALSVSVKKLESIVGAKLLNREPRGVSLTLAGTVFLEYVKSGLAKIEQAQKSAKMVVEGELGLIRLGFVGSATYNLLPLCLPAFSSSFPEVQIQLCENTTLGLVQLLKSHEIDAGIVRGPVKPDVGLVSWELVRDDMVLAVPASHRFATVGSAALADCTTEKFVMYSHKEVPGLYNITISLCLGAGFTPNICQEAIQVQTLVSLVASGMGIALVPATTKSHVVNNVKFVELTDAAAKSCLSFHLLANSGSSSVLVENLRKSLNAVLSDNKNIITTK